MHCLLISTFADKIGKNFDSEPSVQFRYKNTNKNTTSKGGIFIGALGRNRTGTGLLPTDFKSLFIGFY